MHSYVYQGFVLRDTLVFGVTTGNHTMTHGSDRISPDIYRWMSDDARVHQMLTSLSAPCGSGVMSCNEQADLRRPDAPGQLQAVIDLFLSPYFLQRAVNAMLLAWSGRRAISWPNLHIKERQTRSGRRCVRGEKRWVCVADACQFQPARKEDLRMIRQLVLQE